MAYQRKTYLLTWKDEDERHPLHGFEVKLKGLTLGDMQTVTSLQSLQKDLAETRDMSLLDPFVDLLEKKIISWNLQDEEGQDVQPDREGIINLDMTVLLPMMSKWMEQAGGGLSTPLSKGSSSGTTMPVDSIPMEPLSPSLPS